jgi:hypothetical protein
MEVYTVFFSFFFASASKKRKKKAEEEKDCAHGDNTSKYEKKKMIL